MIFLNKLMRQLLIFLTIFCCFTQANASEQQIIEMLINRFYQEPAWLLLCKNQAGEHIDELISVPRGYFSDDLMKYYEPACLGLVQRVDGFSIWAKDIRTGETLMENYRGGFTNLTLHPPKLKGTHATLRATYDLPDAPYKNWGNYTVFTLTKEYGQWKIDDIELGGRDMNKYNERESMTGLVAHKSLKRYFKQSLEEVKADKL